MGAVLWAHADRSSGKQGDVLTVQFTGIGIPRLGLNGGPALKYHEAFSHQVATDDQADTDPLWNSFVGNGWREGARARCKDKWSLPRQITPRVLSAAVADLDRATAQRAFEAMMKLGRIDIAAIESAWGRWRCLNPAATSAVRC